MWRYKHTRHVYLYNTIFCFLWPGRATYTDKLFKFRNGRFEDLLNDEINEQRDVANRMAGRSVACVDRKVTDPHHISSDESLRHPVSLSCSLLIICGETHKYTSTAMVKVDWEAGGEPGEAVNLIFMKYFYLTEHHVTRQDLLWELREVWMKDYAIPYNPELISNIW